MGVCILNHLFAWPTAETRDLIHSFFSGTPFELLGMGVELGSSRSPIQVNKAATYRALPGSIGIWYDVATANSYVLLPLIPAPEMAARNAEIGDGWGRTFVPYMPLVINPVNRRRYKSILNSIATGLVDLQPVLTFDRETLAELDSSLPRHNEFYQDYKARGGVSNQVFLDLDSGID